MTEPKREEYDVHNPHSDVELTCVAVYSFSIHNKNYYTLTEGNSAQTLSEDDIQSYDLTSVDQGHVYTCQRSTKWTQVSSLRIADLATDSLLKNLQFRNADPELEKVRERFGSQIDRVVALKHKFAISTKDFQIFKDRVLKIGGLISITYTDYIQESSEHLMVIRNMVEAAIDHYLQVVASLANSVYDRDYALGLLAELYSHKDMKKELINSLLELVYIREEAEKMEEDVLVLTQMDLRVEEARSLIDVLLKQETAKPEIKLIQWVKTGAREDSRKLLSTAFPLKDLVEFMKRLHPAMEWLEVDEDSFILPVGKLSVVVSEDEVRIEGDPKDIEKSLVTKKATATGGKKPGSRLLNLEE